MSLGFKQQQSQEKPATAVVQLCRQEVNPTSAGMCTTSRDKCHCSAEGHTQGAARKGLGMCKHRSSLLLPCATLCGWVHLTIEMTPVSFSNFKTVILTDTVWSFIFFNYCMIGGGFSLKGTSLPMFLYPLSSLFARKTVGTIEEVERSPLNIVSGHAFYKYFTTSLPSWLWLISGF